MSTLPFPATAPSPGLSLGDIYYVLFRRKWLILSLSLAGIAAALITWAAWQPKYVSVAKLFVVYVDNATPPGEGGVPQGVQTPDHSALILQSELEILKNFDLAKKVAAEVGPGKILGDPKLGTNTDFLNDAAYVIMKDLSVEVPRMTSVIAVSFSHPDATIVQSVLDDLVTNYIDKGIEIHQNPAMYTPLLRQEIDVLTSKLHSVDDEMARLKSDNNITDVEETIKGQATETALIRTEVDKIIGDLAEKEAQSLQLSNQYRRMVAANTVTTTNSAATPVATAESPKPEQVEAYNKVRAELAKLYQKEDDLESHFSPTYSLVVANKNDIAAAESRKQKMEKDVPSLTMYSSAATPGEARTTGYATENFANKINEAYESSQVVIAGLNAKLQTELNMLDKARTNGSSLNGVESQYRGLAIKRASIEGQLEQLQQKSVKLDMEDRYGQIRITGVSIIQHPTSPARDTAKVRKTAAAIGVGGILAGVVLAFLMEMMLDRSFKRPQEVMAKLAYPFFLAVPYLNGNTRPKLSLPGKNAKLLTEGTPPQRGGGATVGDGSGGGAIVLPGQTGNNVAPWDEKHALRPFHETLRDRLIAYFEMINLTHKPKLVALTSCHHGAGVSTMAAGLASSLSETGDGNVLLVNMNSDEGDAHQFYKGRLNVGLDEILDEKDDRATAMVQDNLYVVRESPNSDKLPAALPKRFSKLVGKLKASDYDYIIFDMPPVTQISVTPRLARFMDMVLMVVESEKTDRDVAAKVSSLLSESRANVGVVLNKQKSYVPKQLHQEF